MAFYSSSIIAFSGAYGDDRRFFGLVTFTGSRQNYSCHVFMVEPKLLSHSEHVKRARCFGIHCTGLAVPKSGQVLGLQECAEFPATADCILNSILRLHRPADEVTPRSPSEASTRLESTNSSNSDSGIGFRDDCDRNSAQIYDILEPERSNNCEIKAVCKSPQPSRRKDSPAIRKSVHRSVGAFNMSTGSGHELQMKSRHASRESGKSRATSTSSFQYGSDAFGKSTSSFDADPSSLQEILCSSASCKREFQSISCEMPSTSKEMRKSAHRLSLDGNRQPPRPIEVSVLVTPPRQREKRQSMPKIAPQVSSPQMNEEFNKSNPNRASMARNGTRSLENLCMPDEEVPVHPLDSRNSIGSSTPALNQVCKRVFVLANIISYR